MCGSSSTHSCRPALARLLAECGHLAEHVADVRAGNTTRQALLDWFSPLLEQVIAMIDSGDRLIELR